MPFATYTPSFSWKGILFPNVQSAAQAAQSVANCYYPSAEGISGTRGFGYGGCNIDGTFEVFRPSSRLPLCVSSHQVPIWPWILLCQFFLNSFERTSLGRAFAEYAVLANDRIVAGVQLEHYSAFEPDTLADILAVPGLCFTQDGPYDHSGSHLVPGQTSDPRVVAELARYRAVRSFAESG